jgi:uncharacterized protein (TIGR02646 family)
VRQITKGAEPPSLTAHRKTPFADYQNYAAKDDLRHSLVKEQRALCSYCMGRIQPGTMKIEHWQSQAVFPDQQLNYRNILGGCLGGEGQPGRFQHCDTRKGNQELRWNPAEPAHHIETRLTYEFDGTIRSTDDVFDQQLNDVLNLNLPLIKNNRKGVLASLLAWWKAEKPLPRERIEQEIQRWSTGDTLTPYCQVTVWWLRQKLERKA